MHRIRRHLTYANVMSTIAVTLAVVGGSTAVAVTVNASKKSDVNKKGNIRAGRVTAQKLADGNVVASKLAGINVVEADSPGSFAQAQCPVGERPIGGGASVTGGAVLTLSAPDQGGWKAGTNGGGNLAVYAICLKATPGL
jgi:hypothetical protein